MLFWSLLASSLELSRDSLVRLRCDWSSSLLYDLTDVLWWRNNVCFYDFARYAFPTRKRKKWNKRQKELKYSKIKRIAKWNHKNKLCDSARAAIPLKKLRKSSFKNRRKKNNVKEKNFSVSVYKKRYRWTKKVFGGQKKILVDKKRFWWTIVRCPWTKIIHGQWTIVHCPQKLQDPIYLSLLFYKKLVFFGFFSPRFFKNKKEGEKG